MHQSLSDFGETAGLIAQMDLVISVDTSVAHLAAAMGKPVWLLLPADADYRWMDEREDSPWYSSVKLIRQACIPELTRRVKKSLFYINKP
jgi:ADP-heptose:LPS heptosyltransferase